MRARSPIAGKRKPGRAGRPVEFDRGTAVHAAMDEFWKRGFEAVSASDLAAAMSIERSSFYNSFGDRETVFLEALRAYGRLVPDRVLGEIRPGQSVKPILRRVFREICRVRAGDPDARGCLIVNSVGELVGVNEKLGRRIEAAVENSIAVYRALLRQAVAQGEIAPPADIPGAARAFAAFVSGLNTVSKVIRSERELWAMCEAFLRRFGFGPEREPR